MHPVLGNHYRSRGLHYLEAQSCYYSLPTFSPLNLQFPGQIPLYLLLCLVSLEELCRVGLLPQQGGRGRAAFQLDVGQHGLGAGAVCYVLNILFVIFLGIFLRFTICPIIKLSPVGGIISL